MDPLFWELHDDLPRQGPGAVADTKRALALTGLRGPLSVIDAGCGPGAASLVLLEALPEAHVTAIDLHAPFLDTTRSRAETAGLADRLTTVCGDMTTPPAAPGSVDLIWCEAAIYAPGIVPALAAWAPLIAPGGRVLFSELIWIDPAPPQAARAFWAGEYPGMTDHGGVLAQIEQAGFRCLESVALSEDGWDAYYAPLAARGATLEAVHGADHPVLVENRTEIEMRAKYGASYGYQFYLVAP